MRDRGSSSPTYCSSSDRQRGSRQQEQPGREAQCHRFQSDGKPQWEWHIDSHPNTCRQPQWEWHIDSHPTTTPPPPHLKLVRGTADKTAASLQQQVQTAVTTDLAERHSQLHDAPIPGTELKVQQTAAEVQTDQDTGQCHRLAGMAAVRTGNLWNRTEPPQA